MSGAPGIRAELIAAPRVEDEDDRADEGGEDPLGGENETAPGSADPSKPRTFLDRLGVPSFDAVGPKTRRHKTFVPRELTREQESGLSSAFALFDDAGLGRLDESQLREVLRSADACVGGDERALARLARSIAARASGGPDAGVTLEDLKHAVKNSNIYALQDGRFYVALSLAEAESLRAAMHASKRSLLDGSGDGALVPFHNAELGLRLAAPGGGGALLEATAGYRPAELFQAATATQCFRFLDSQMDFEDHEVSLLLRALQSSPREHRAAFFESVKAVRRRPRVPRRAPC